MNASVFSPEVAGLVTFSSRVGSAIQKLQTRHFASREQPWHEAPAATAWLCDALTNLGPLSRALAAGDVWTSQMEIDIVIDFFRCYAGERIDETHPVFHRFAGAIGLRETIEGLEMLRDKLKAIAVPTKEPAAAFVTA